MPIRPRYLLEDLAGRRFFDLFVYRPAADKSFNDRHPGDLVERADAVPALAAVCPGALLACVTAIDCLRRGEPASWVSFLAAGSYAPQFSYQAFLGLAALWLACQ